MKVFLWTLFALSLILVINQFLDLHSIIYEHRYIVLLIALLIGLIPESGPHLVFISMFFSGSIPFSILFANSFVQDGHGALPLFAESKAMFFKIKILKFVIAGVLGVVMLYFNF
ncbi:MAG: hypothetical protein IPO21_05215 [Bacteroidales bacterium]|nr:hypothetical protein [Bacteroidales bacterium]